MSDAGCSSPSGVSGEAEQEKRLPVRGKRRQRHRIVQSHRRQKMQRREEEKNDFIADLTYGRFSGCYDDSVPYFEQYVNRFRENEDKMWNFIQK